MIIIASYSNITVTYTANGTQTVFSFPFDYLRKAFVYVQFNDETILEQGTDYTVSEKTVVFPSAPAAETIIEIYRETTTTPLVSWADASVLRAKDMTIQQIQDLHILEEVQYYTQRNLTEHIDETYQDVKDDIADISDQLETLDENVAITQECADRAEEAALTATIASDEAVQANNSVQGALVDADALLQATKGYISAATVDSIWDPEVTYSAGDVVMTSDGAVYRCIQGNTNMPPVTSPNYWALITTTELFTFEYDNNGDLMPLINPNPSQNWDLDENTDIMPSSLTTIIYVDNEEF